MITTDFDARYFRRFYVDEKTQCASESDLSLQAVRAFSTAASLYGTTKLNVAEVGAGRPKVVDFPTVVSVAEVAAYRFCAERSLIRPRIGKPSSLLYLTYPTATDRPDMDPKRSDMRQHFHAHAAVKAAFVERGWRELGLGFWMRGNPPPYAWGVDLQR